MNTMKLEYRDFLKEAIKDAIDIQLDGFKFDDIVDGLSSSFDYYIVKRLSCLINTLIFYVKTLRRT